MGTGMGMKNNLVRLGTDCHIDVAKLIKSRLLIQANSGGGKSYTIRKLLEITHSHVQQIVLDREGEFHTLREKFDYLLAGKDGDCAVNIQTAQKLALRLLETKASAIIDLSELGPQRDLFVQRFLDAMTESPRALWHPVLVVVDEAHLLCPEKGSSVASNAVKGLMTLGRKRGFAGVLATQRISKLDKDAAAECNSKLIGRCSLDVDRKRAGDEVGFVDKEEIRSLRKLREGQFYAFGPAISTVEGFDTVALIQVGTVKTTHLESGQGVTVKPTQPSAKIRKLISEIDDLPQEIEAEAKSVDELKAKVRELQTKLKAQPKVVEAKTVAPKIVEKSVVKPAEVARVEKVVTKLDALAAKLLSTSGELLTALRKVDSRVSTPTPDRKPQHVPPAESRVPVPSVRKSDSAAPRTPSREVHDENAALKGGPKAILEALIQYETGCSLEQLTVLTGYKQTSRYEYLRQLKGRGLATETADGRHHATDEGRAMLPDVKPLPTGDELRVLAMSRLKGGPKALFEVFVDAYPDALTKGALMDRLEQHGSPYKETSIYEYTRQLVAHELIDKSGPASYRASSNLFDQYD